jgi:GMP synthase-like glutamine amidotransferase
MKQISVGILETGLPPEEYREQFGSYPDMFQQLLNGSDQQISFKYYHILDNDIPQNANECDAWLITGSKFGVYEGHAWIEPVSALVREAYEQDIPTIGICFGHQLIAQALGGKVIKSSKGWSLGVTQYEMENHPQWMGNKADKFAIQAYHQDQVVELPDNTQVIASSGFCPYAALNFDNKAISFQGHPEFGAPYTKLLLSNRRDLKLLPYELSSKAIEGIETPIQRETVAQWICDFLHYKLAKK